MSGGLFLPWGKDKEEKVRKTQISESVLTQEKKQKGAQDMMWVGIASNQLCSSILVTTDSPSDRTLQSVGKCKAVQLSWHTCLQNTVPQQHLPSWCSAQNCSAGFFPKTTDFNCVIMKNRAMDLYVISADSGVSKTFLLPADYSGYDSILFWFSWILILH